MLTLSHYLRIIYFNLTAVWLPENLHDSYYAELIYRYAAGFPAIAAGGKNSSFWISAWYFNRTGQSHRTPDATRPVWFWLAKVYDQAVNGSAHNPNGQVGYASAEFWAEKLAGVPGLGGGASQTYAQKLIAQGWTQLLALSETSGLVMTDSSGNALNGTYEGGVSLNQGTFTDGTPYGTWDGLNDYGNAFSAGLASAFSLSAGTLACWVKMDVAGRWEDTNYYWFADMYVDGNNRFQIIKDNAARRIAVYWFAGGTLKTVNYDIPVAPVDFVHIAATKSAGTLRLYLNGSEVGTPATSVGDMTGALTSSFLGQYSGSSFYLPGNIKYRGYKSSAMSAAEILAAATI